MKNFEQWNGFKGNRWKEKIDVRNFIGMNYTPYDGMPHFFLQVKDRMMHMTVMLLSWKDLQKLQTNCGASSRHFRKKNVLKAEFLIWRQR